MGDVDTNTTYTSLPANGGNADTVDNKHASDFATAAQGTKADNALPKAGGNLSGHIYLTGAKPASSTASTSQIVFGTSSDQHVAISSNTKAIVINPNTTTTTNQIVLYLDKASQFPSGISGNLYGNASTATKFASSQSVALTGDVTGSASSKAGWSVATTLADSGVTAGSYGPSANASPAHGNTFSVPYITVDAKGRVTSASTKTITLPADNNTGGTVEYDGKQYTIIPDVDNPYFAFFGDSILNTKGTRLRSDKYIAEFIPGTGAKFYDAETEKLLWTSSNNRLNNTTSHMSTVDRYYTSLYDYDDEIFTVQHYYPLSIQGGNRLYVYSPSTKKYANITDSSGSYNERGKVYYVGNDGTYAYFIMGDGTKKLNKRALTDITTSVSTTNFTSSNPVPQAFHKGKGYTMIGTTTAAGTFTAQLKEYYLASGATSVYTNYIYNFGTECDEVTVLTVPKILWIEDDENGDYPVFYVAYSKTNTGSYDILGKIYYDYSVYNYTMMDITIPGLQGGLQFIAYQGHINDNTVLLTMKDAADIPMVYKITMCTEPGNAACGSYEIDGIADITVDTEKQIMLGKIYSKFYHKSKYMALNNKSYLINLDDMSTVDFKYKASSSATELTTGILQQSHYGIVVGLVSGTGYLSSHEILVYSETINASTGAKTSNQSTYYGPYKELSNCYGLVAIKEVEG